MAVGGYAGKILRVDLTTERLIEEELDEAFLRKYPGGTALGVKFMYDEVPPGVEWDDPENRFIIASGPMAGTRVVGAGTITVITKGPLTNGLATTQANGFLGAYMKFAGYDAIIVQGRAKGWKYLYMHDGTAELRDANHLRGKDTWETQEAIAEELGKDERSLSVFSTGPAGENLVKIAAVSGDRGHVAGHNGTGAVMGAKKLKAVAAARSAGRVVVKDSALTTRLANGLFDELMKDPDHQVTYNWGTLTGITRAPAGGWLPIKNYTTNIYPIEPEKLAKYGAEYIRSHFEAKAHPCWACRMHHCHMFKVTEGRYVGEIVEEPEYEQFAAFGPVVGGIEVGDTIYLSNVADRLAFDTNEAGWLLAWVIELYEKGIFTKEDTDGLEMTWGNSEAIRQMMYKIAYRDGIGDILAEGIMRAAQRIGGEAASMAIHTLKGNSPRGHDHRAVWTEMFDTCVSNSGTIETVRSLTQEEMQRLGAPFPVPQFDAMQISNAVALTKGSMQFEDSLGTCRFTTRTRLTHLPQILNAITGWDVDFDEAMQIGRRAVNLMRAFNLRHGITADKDAPSERYSSSPVDGPAQGISIRPHWEAMRRNYYEKMGWDVETSRPRPETLRALGLEEVVRDIWEVEPAR